MSVEEFEQGKQWLIDTFCLISAVFNAIKEIKKEGNEQIDPLGFFVKNGCAFLLTADTWNHIETANIERIWTEIQKVLQRGANTFGLLHQISFCFDCSHLTSGQKEGDELRRNSDVMEILRKTRFPRVHGICDEKSPETILEHDIVAGFYFLLRAVNQFAANYNSFPGQFNGEMDEDISRLKTTAVSLLSDLGCNGSTLTEDLINEMCRYSAAELHAVAAFGDGIASQEVIKLITKQFIPMSGTFIFNGIDHKSQLLSL